MQESKPSGHDIVDVVIVGGGNAGVSLAAYLHRKAPDLSVCLVAPQSTHLYRPLLSYVGGGLCSVTRATRDQDQVLPRGVRWQRDRVTTVLPSAEQGVPHRVLTAAGAELRAADLVLCPGTQIDWDAIPGSHEACTGGNASTNYLPELAPHTWDVLRGLTHGRAVFLVSNRNTPCPGVGLKPLFLAADHWRKAGRLTDIDITLIMEDEQPTGLARADQRLRTELSRLGVRVWEKARLGKIDADGRVIVFTDAAGQRQEQRYDAMHLAPPHRGYDWLVTAGLTDPATSLIANDPATLEHPSHPGLWALGDAATLGTSSSGGGLRHQVPVVTHNLLARRAGTTYARYDGYTVAPIPIDRRRLLLAEQDRHGREVRTLSAVSLARPTRALFDFDLRLQPWVYWHRLLRGRGLQES